MALSYDVVFNFTVLYCNNYCINYTLLSNALLANTYENCQLYVHKISSI